MRHLVVLVAFLTAACAPSLAQGGAGSRGIVLQGPQRPFTDSMAAMVERDRTWQAEIEAGLRPAPPPMIAIGSHVRKKQKPVYEGDGPFALFLPAAFRDPEPRHGQIRDYRTLSPQDIGVSFTGIRMQDQSGTFWIPPDTCGAIGPDHFAEILNGSFAIYTRTGTRLSHVTLNSFMTFSSGGTTYPRSYAFDPRLVYDRRSARWFATALEYNGGNWNHAILAVSRTSNPSGTWDKYLLEIGRDGWFTDYPTIGLDDNGVYIAVTLFSATTSTKFVVATRKASLIAASPYLDTLYQQPDTNEYYSTPYTAVSLDATPPDGKAWVVASNPSYYRDMRISSIEWPVSGAPIFGAVVNLTLPEFAEPPTAPAKGSTTNIDAGDMRMHSATMRGGKVWTCRTIGVNAAGGGSGADRTAVEWIEIDVTGAAPVITQSGRLYDGAPTNPVFFYYPSVAVNGLGHMALSFSDSNGNRYVAAETTGRLADDPPGSLQAVLGLQSGLNSYTRVAGGYNRWGDYSTTSVDPNDDLSIWTVQEYATATRDSWGTWVTQLLSPAPTLDNPAGSAQAGTTGVALSLTGTGIYDPGPGFPNRLTVELTGGATNGISNYQVTYNGPTSASVTFDIAGDATPGARDIVLTNPDGRQATVIGGFTVTANGLTSLTVSPVAGAIGETVSLQATLTRVSDGTPVSGETISFTVSGAAVGSGTTDGSGTATAPYAIPEAGGTGSFSIGAAFAGNPPLDPSSGTSTLTVSKSPTTTAVPAVAGKVRETVNLTATLTRDTDSAPLAGRTISFQIAGSGVGDAVTDGVGTATLPYAIPESLGVGVSSLRGDFGGDGAHLASFGTADLTVSMGDTILVAADITTQLGAVADLTATLTCSQDGLAVVGRTLDFTVAGTGVGSATTGGTGSASLPYLVPVAGGPRTDPIGAAFAGDTFYSGSSDTANLVVGKAGTALAVANATGGFGDTVNLTATLTRTTDAAPLDGRTVAFSVEGSAVGDGATDTAGVATIPYTIPEALGWGARAIVASFAGDADHDPSNGSGVLDVIPWPTSVTASDASGTVGQTTTLAAVLIRSDTLEPLEGRQIAFSVEGTSAGSAATDATGSASLNWVIADTVGSGVLSLVASFDGDATHGASSDTAALTVAKAATTHWTMDRVGTITELVILRQFDLASVPGGVMLSGKTVQYSVEGTVVGSGVTNAGGDSTLNWIITDGPATRTIATEFAGDTAYLGSAAQATLTAETHATKMYGIDRDGPITAYRILKAWLYRLDSTPVVGKTIAFSLDGTPLGTDPTRSTGLAQVGYTIADGTGAGIRTIQASWGGDGGYLPSSCTNTLTVTKATPYIWVMPRSVPVGGVARLYAYFRRLADYQKQEGKTVTFRVDGTWVADVLTGTGADAGIARFNYTVVETPGAHTIRCEFGGDAWVSAGYGEAGLTIY